ALVAVRIRGGRGAAIKATIFFLVLRGALTLLIAPILGRSTLHFPLYLAEAVIVELVALRVSPTRQLTFGFWCGALIGTVGLAAEWGWSHAWMPLPWHASLLPEAAVLGFVAAMGGGIIGALVGRSLRPPDASRQRTPRAVAALAWVAAFAVVAIPLPMTAHQGYRATVHLTTVRTGPERAAMATVRLTPPDAAAGANWFDVTDWQ